MSNIKQDIDEQAHPAAMCPVAVQTLMFEDDEEMAWERDMLLVSCYQVSLSRHVDNSPLWEKTKRYLDRVAETFETLAWDDCTTPADLKKLAYAVRLEQLGHASF
jgi:hypothetical protein